MSHDRLRPIDPDRCWELVARRGLGRLGVIEGGAPLVLPVNYLVDGETIVLRTNPGSKLDAALRAPVAFEVDDVDEQRHQGWSVVIRGRADEVTEYDGERYEHLWSLALHPWAGGDRDRWLRITPNSVTGRCLPAEP